MSRTAADTQICEIGMTDLSDQHPPEPVVGHSPKLWLGYNWRAERPGSLNFAKAGEVKPTPRDMVRRHPAPGDRLLDIDLRRQTGRTKFVFRIVADYTDHGQEFAVAFASHPFVFGSKDAPPVDHLFEHARVSDDRRMASFEFDTGAVAGWDIADHLRSIGCPIVRIPFRFELIDEQFSFPSWMMPEPDDPVYEDSLKAGTQANEVDPILWHGGPHPPAQSFLVIPTGA